MFMTEANKNVSILQIIPAVNWFAIYEHNAAVDANRAVPILCWALVDDGNSKTKIVGMVNKEDSSEIVDASTLPNFEAYELMEDRMEEFVDLKTMN